MFWSNKLRGFTLVEMLVSVFIITMLATVIFLSVDKYADPLNLKTDTYNLAVYIRQAQAYSLAVRTDGGAGDQFDRSYGVYLNEDSSQSFIFFLDSDGNNKYDPGELLQTVPFTSGVKVNRVCGTAPGGADDCLPSSIRNLAITFKRPSPTAILKFLNFGGSTPMSSPSLPARIYLRNNAGAEMRVSIDSTGQVAIQ